MRHDARQIVHDTFAVPAILIVDEVAREVTVRLHEREKPLGLQHGAESFERMGKAILRGPGLTVKRGDVLSVAQGEAYHVETVHPSPQGVIVAEITRLDAADAEGLPTP